MRKGIFVTGAIPLLLFIAVASFAGGGQEAGAKGVVTFWHQANVADPTDPNVVWQQGNFDTFKAKYPNITVERTIVANGDEYLNKISTAMAAGSAPDIFQTWMSGRLEPFVKAGRVIPLDDIINADPELKSVTNPAFFDTAPSVARYMPSARRSLRRSFSTTKRSSPSTVVPFPRPSTIS
jgi:ABC-type glycerol-3-phosphate transport system substrate-binding protein